MKLAIEFCFLFAAQIFIKPCTTDLPNDWKDRDWAADMYEATEEPVENPQEWVHYLYTLGKDYPEYPEEKSTKKPFVGPDEEELKRDPPDWYELAPLEDPYLAVVYREEPKVDDLFKVIFPDEPQPTGSYIYPGTACGGAFITRRHVLTPCGCVATFLSRLLKERSPFLTGYLPYDIFNYNDDKVPTLYVTHMIHYFKPDFIHQIDTDPEKLPTWSGLNCRDAMTQIGKKHKPDWDEAKKSAKANAYPTLLPFKPELKLDYITMKLIWPPAIINHDTDKEFIARMDLISAGMKLSKPGRTQFYSSITGSITNLRHCNTTSVVCNTTRVELRVMNTCLCPLRPGLHKLSGGVIGWPVVQKGSLVGITGSERHPSDGTVVLNVLHTAVMKLIEKVVGKKELEDQQTPPPKYRQKDLKDKYLIYDYDSLKQKPQGTTGTDVPKSKSTWLHIGPTTLVASAATVTSTITVL